MKNIISTNLKKLRLAKNYTQEQVAELLNINVQSVSRWECGTSMPDILLLPEIARFFGVTVDDLYREKTVAYENTAQRFAAIYESTKHPEDFIRADIEFKKLIKSGCYSMNDLRMYGILHQHMMNYCLKRAEDLFEEVQTKTSENDDNYWKTRRQKQLLFSQTGRNLENISLQLEMIKNKKNKAREYELLIMAYSLAGCKKEAFESFERAVKLFPEDCSILLCGGDLCNELEMFDKAFEYWDRALEINSLFYDAKYSKGFCYQKLGDYKKAYDVWCEIVEDLECAGYKEEKSFPQELANKCKMKFVNKK